MACEDFDPCTADRCSGGTCIHTLLSRGTCDDGDICTTGDRCQNGRCRGEEMICSDGNICTQGRCENGRCRFFPRPDPWPCDDGDPCTIGEYCRDGFCDGVILDCDDNNACTLDSCETGMCRRLIAPRGSPCPGGTCSRGICVPM